MVTVTLVNPEFDGTPLVVGSVVGLRSFNVTADGTLRGVAFHYPFEPGENIAQHRYPMGEWFNIMASLGYNHRPTLPTSAPESHRVAAVNCSCGFYAYTTGHNQYRSRAHTLTGIIEGYGRVTVGPKGFRAEKARLLALVNPDESRWDAYMNRWFVAPSQRSELAVRFDLAVDRYREATTYPTLRDALKAHPLGGKS